MDAMSLPLKKILEGLHLNGRKTRCKFCDWGRLRCTEF
jgi:hypothetical protein